MTFTSNDNDGGGWMGSSEEVGGPSAEVEVHRPSVDERPCLPVRPGPSVLVRPFPRGVVFTSPAKLDTPLNLEFDRRT